MYNQIDIISVLLIIITILSIIYQLLTVYCAFSFRISIMRSEKKIKKIKKWPKVVCFKPLHGIHKSTIHNVVSFMKLDYPNYKTIFGIADNKDPAFEIIKIMKKYFPYEIIISVGEAESGTNRKIRNMMHMEKYLPSDTEIVIISDADIRVDESYIKSMVFPFLNDPEVGATTCVYKTIRSKKFPQVIEGLYVETNFAPSVLLASRFAPLKYAFGASIAIRADVLKKIGGFAVLKDYLADDYMLARKVIEAGYKIKLAPYVASMVSTSNTTKAAFQHILRWNRTIQVCNPIGYLFSAICYPFFWGVLAALYCDGAFFTAQLLTFSGFTRMICSKLVAICLDSETLKSLMAPFWDIISVFMWFIGLFGDRVIWGEREYKILPDGKFVQMK